MLVGRTPGYQALPQSVNKAGKTQKENKPAFGMWGFIPLQFKKEFEVDPNSRLGRRIMKEAQKAMQEGEEETEKNIPIVGPGALGFLKFEKKIDIK